MKLNSAFHRLFLAREGKVILGKRWANLIVVFIILLATFFALGLSNGSTLYLKNKMSDPFNTWISFTKHINIEPDNLKCLMDSLNSNQLKERFNINKSATHFYDYITCPLLNDSNKYISTRVWLITLDQEDELFKFLADTMLTTKNQKCKDQLTNNFNESHGVIIKRGLLDELGYKNNDQNYLKYKIRFVSPLGNQGNIDLQVSIPILGFVDDLPLGVDFVCNYNTYTYLKYPFYNVHSLKNCVYEIEDLDTVLHKQIFISKHEDVNEVKRQLNINISKIDKSNFWESNFVSGDFYEISYEDTLLEQLSDDINQKYPHKSVHLVESFKSLSEHRKCEWNNYWPTPPEPGFVTIQLKDLKYVYELKNYLDAFPENNNFNSEEPGLINIDISAVKSRENLHFISELTKVLSIFLLLFSMFSIILFLVNIINSHFEKIKQNIGTLKAFGLSNQKLIGNYIFIYMLIIFSASLFAFFFANLMGQSGMAVFIFNLLDITIEKGETCFHLFNMKGLGAFVIILILAMGVVYYKLLKILRSTPGDLIFER